MCKHKLDAENIVALIKSFSRLKSLFVENLLKQTKPKKHLEKRFFGKSYVTVS